MRSMQLAPRLTPLQISISALIFVLSCSAASAQNTLQVVMTAYSSTEAQTDGTPTITATGAEVREGIIAVSRDLLETQLPYGTKVRVVNLQTEENGCGGFDTGILNVQDTMSPEKTNQVDLWLPTTEQALEWGRCTATLEVVSYE